MPINGVIRGGGGSNVRRGAHRRARRTWGKTLGTPPGSMRAKRTKRNYRLNARGRKVTAQPRMIRHAVDREALLRVHVEAALHQIEAQLDVGQVRPVAVRKESRQVHVAEARCLVVREWRAAPDDVAKQDAQRPDLDRLRVVKLVVQNLCAHAG